jgi:hypothetical protein
MCRNPSILTLNHQTNPKVQKTILTQTLDGGHDAVLMRLSYKVNYKKPQYIRHPIGEGWEESTGVQITTQGPRSWSESAGAWH